MQCSVGRVTTLHIGSWIPEEDQFNRVVLDLDKSPARREVSGSVDVTHVVTLTIVSIVSKMQYAQGGNEPQCVDYKLILGVLLAPVASVDD